MNLTPLEHAAYALLMQAAIGVATGNWWAGAAFGCAFFLGREHAQYEYGITNGGPVGRLKPWEGFAAWRWSKDAQLDLLAPAIAVLPAALWLA